MTTNKILQEFRNSNIKIKSITKLEEYIKFCFESNQKNKTKFKTSYHHILPNKLFTKYKNLKSNKWNGVHLLHKDHYYAHWLLTESIDNYSMLSAFCQMHKCDVSNGRILKSELINLEIFQKKIEENNKATSIFLTKDIIINNKKTTLSKEISKKTKITRSKPIILEDGSISSINKEVAIKSVNTKHKEYYDTKLQIFTTIQKENNKNCAATMRKNGRHYNIFHIEKGLIHKKMCNAEVTKMHQHLKHRSKDNYMGMSKTSKAQLEKFGKSYLIGLYSVEV